jgi:hypothetical protein
MRKITSATVVRLLVSPEPRRSRSSSSITSTPSASPWRACSRLAACQPGDQSSSTPSPSTLAPSSSRRSLISRASVRQAARDDHRQSVQRGGSTWSIRRRLVRVDPWPTDRSPGPLRSSANQRRHRLADTTVRLPSMDSISSRGQRRRDPSSEGNSCASCFATRSPTWGTPRAKTSRLQRPRLRLLELGRSALAADRSLPSAAARARASGSRSHSDASSVTSPLRSADRASCRPDPRSPWRHVR